MQNKILVLLKNRKMLKILCKLELLLKVQKITLNNLYPNPVSDFNTYDESNFFSNSILMVVLSDNHSQNAINSKLQYHSD